MFYFTLRKVILNSIYTYYKLSNKKAKKVLIKNELSYYKYLNTKLPARIFTPLNSYKCAMGNLSVMVGRYQEKDFQYCLLYDLYVKSIYRERHIAEKVVLSAIKFVQREKFANVIAILKLANTPSLNLFKKMGFQLVNNEELYDYEKKEIEFYKEPVIVARYEINKQ